MHNTSKADLIIQISQQQIQIIHRIFLQIQHTQGTPIHTSTSKQSSLKSTSNYHNPNQHLHSWRYGACNHQSKNCQNKAEAHQDDSTFENRIGGGAILNYKSLYRGYSSLLKSESYTILNKCS